MSGSGTRPSGDGRVLSRGQGGGEDNRRGGSGAAEPDIEDEDSCNMTAVDPTSMLRSGSEITCHSLFIFSICEAYGLHYVRLFF